MKKIILLLAIGLFVGLSNSCSSDDRVTNNDEQNLQNPDDPNNPDNPKNLSLMEETGCRVSKVVFGEEEIEYPYGENWDWEAEGLSWSQIKDNTEKKITGPYYMEFIYDNQGRIVHRIHIPRNSKYKYISFSGEVKQEFYQKMTTDFIYDDNTGLIKEYIDNTESYMLTYGEQPTKLYSTRKTIFNYNDKKQLIETHNSEDNGSVSLGNIYEYDNEGNLYRNTYSMNMPYTIKNGIQTIIKWEKVKYVESNFEYENDNLLGYLETYTHEVNTDKSGSRYHKIEYYPNVNSFYNHVSNPLVGYVYSVGIPLSNRNMVKSNISNQGYGVKYTYTFTENGLLKSANITNIYNGGEDEYIARFEYTCQ